jgi:polysaccharide biosynthesis protein PslF
MNLNKSINIAFLSTYPPRECGIATFTQDLVTQMGYFQSTRQSRVIAVSNEPMRYDNKVMMELIQHDRSSYEQTAHKLNISDVDLLVIEHEFGIFGGESGVYLLDLIDNLQIPFVTTLHTVLPEPSKMQRYILKTLGQKGKKIITMAKNTVETLMNVYGIEGSKIEVINHGVPFLHMKSRQKLKEEMCLENRFIVSTFGLLSPGKGLEYGVEAIAKVAKEHREVLYYILGQTHPSVAKESGEKYRRTLEKMVADLGIKDNVRFVNKYLTKTEIIHYLNLSDVYLTPYLNKDQAVSGTLAYAVGYGRVIVSTPYTYAKEMLAEGRGLFADFKDCGSIANCIEYVIDNPNVKKKMEQRTLELGKSMMWEDVGAEYKNLFTDVYMKYGNITVTDGMMAIKTNGRKVGVTV